MIPRWVPVGTLGLDLMCDAHIRSSNHGNEYLAQEASCRRAILERLIAYVKQSSDRSHLATSLDEHTYRPEGIQLNDMNAIDKLCSIRN